MRLFLTMAISQHDYMQTQKGLQPITELKLYQKTTWTFVGKEES